MPKQIKCRNFGSLLLHGAAIALHQFRCENYRLAFVTHSVKLVLGHFVMVWHDDDDDDDDDDDLTVKSVGPLG